MLSFKEHILTEGINDRGKFKAVFIVGTPSAGKSTVLDKIGNGRISPRMVNTDIPFEHMAKKAGYTDSDMADEDAQTKAWLQLRDRVKIVAKNQLSNYIDGMLPLFIDGTSSNPTNLTSRAAALRAIGYDVACVWVDTPIDVAIKRLEDALGSDDGRNRTVSKEFFERAYKRAPRAKAYFEAEFKNFTVVNNDAGKFTDDVAQEVFKSMTAFFDSPVENMNGEDEKIR